MKSLVGVAFLAFLSLACSTTPPPSAQRRVLNVAGRQIEYIFTTCAPALVFDGTKINVEGLEVPAGAGVVNQYVNFKVGKIGLDPEVQRQLTEYTTRYKMLMDETCKTLLILDAGSRERYAIHRDTLMAKFIESASQLENATTDAQVANVAVSGTKTANDTGSAPKPQ